MMNFRETQHAIHQNAREKGFYDKEPDLADRIVHIHAELSELWEHARRGADGLRSVKVPEITNEAEEMADVVIRVMDMAAQRGVDLEEAILLKHEYNTTRPRKHGKLF